MADRFPLILNTGANQIQEIPTGDNLDLTGNNIKSVSYITFAGMSTTDRNNLSAAAGMVIYNSCVIYKGRKHTTPIPKTISNWAHTQNNMQV